MPKNIEKEFSETTIPLDQGRDGMENPLNKSLTEIEIFSLLKSWPGLRARCSEETQGMVNMDLCLTLPSNFQRQGQYEEPSLLQSRRVLLNSCQQNC